MYTIKKADLLCITIYMMNVESSFNLNSTLLIKLQQ